MWQTIHILITILLCISCIGLVLWIYRPNSTQEYDRQSMIPLQDDEFEKGDKNDRKK